MLVLGALEVEHEHIISDYALTEEAIGRMRAWIVAERPEAAERIAAAPQVFFAAQPGAMRVIIDDLVAANGSIAGYVRSIGVPQALDRPPPAPRCSNWIPETTGIGRFRYPER